MNAHGLCLPLFFFLVTTFTAVTRCDEEQKFDEDYDLVTDQNDIDDESHRKAGQFPLCYFPGCSCDGGLLVAVKCTCKSPGPSQSIKRLDFKKVIFPDKRNYTFRVYDCDAVQLDFEGKKKPTFDVFEINRVEWLSIKPHTLENVDRLTLRNVRALLVEERTFATLQARYVELENVTLSSGTIFIPKYILTELKIVNSTFDSSAVIQLDHLGMDRKIIISKNHFKNPITLSLYSHNIELNDNSFDYSEIPNITIRYAQRFESKSNIQGSEATPLPNVIGSGKVIEVVFDDDHVNGSSFTESQKRWLKSFAFETTNKTAIQPRTLEQPHDETSCLIKKAGNTRVVTCPNGKTYSQFVGNGKILVSTNIEGESSPKGGRVISTDDHKHSKRQKSDNTSVLTQSSKKSSAPRITISFLSLLAFIFSLTISNPFF